MNRLKDLIEKDFIKSLKEKNEAKTSTLRLLKNTIKNKEIETQKDLDEAQVIQVVQKEIAQRNESISEFKKGEREDLIKKEEAEIDTLKEYLPKQMEASVLEEIVKSEIKEQNASSISDMGKVMQSIIFKVAGRADNQKIAQMVKKYLK
jgi:uncharacterized protein YqeY